VIPSTKVRSTFKVLITAPVLRSAERDDQTKHAMAPAAKDLAGQSQVLQLYLLLRCYVVLSLLTKVSCTNDSVWRKSGATQLNKQVIEKGDSLPTGTIIARIAPHIPSRRAESNASAVLYNRELRYSYAQGLLHDIFNKHCKRSARAGRHDPTPTCGRGSGLDMWVDGVSMKAQKRPTART
jgi:hypothetical protein